MKLAEAIRTLVLAVAVAAVVTPSPAATPHPSVVAVLHMYEARLRFEGKLSVTQVRASDGGHAKRLVQQQFPKATILSIKKVD